MEYLFQRDGGVPFSEGRSIFFRGTEYLRHRNIVLRTDSTIAPLKKPSDFLSRTFHGCLTRERITLFMENKILIIFLVRKGLSDDDVGGARRTVFRERCGRELVSKPATSLKKCWGGCRRMIILSEEWSTLIQRNRVPLLEKRSTSFSRTDNLVQRNSTYFGRTLTPPCRKHRGTRAYSYRRPFFRNKSVFLDKYLTPSGPSYYAKTT